MADFLIRQMSPADLTAHPLNWRTHPAAQLNALEEAIDTHGWLAAPIWNARTEHLLDGHARVELALVKDEPAIPVRVIDVDEETEKRILASFDKIGEMRERDDVALATLLKELADTPKGLPLGWTNDELSDLLLQLAPADDAGIETLEEEEPLPAEVPSRAALGDLWKLGRHRILCADATDPDALKRLVGDAKIGMVYADPPYGVAVVGRAKGKRGQVGGGGPFGGVKNRGKSKVIPSGNYAPIIGDETTDTAVACYALTADLFPQAVHIWWGGNYYADQLPPSPCWIVWDKQNTGNFADAELAWTNQPSPVRIFAHMWNGMVKASERGESRIHPTQKPIALAEWCLVEYGKSTNALLDPFLGSGASLIACERQEVACFGLELSPAYVDLILARWEKMTGEQAEKL